MHNHLRPFFSNCRLESPNFVHLQQKYQEERQLVYQDEKVLDESKRLRNHEQFQLRYLLLVQFLIDDNSQRLLKVDNAKGIAQRYTNPIDYFLKLTFQRNLHYKWHTFPNS